MFKQAIRLQEAMVLACLLSIGSMMILPMMRSVGYYPGGGWDSESGLFIGIAGAAAAAAIGLGIWTKDRLCTWPAAASLVAGSGLADSLLEMKGLPSGIPASASAQFSLFLSAFGIMKRTDRKETEELPEPRQDNRKSQPPEPLPRKKSTILMAFGDMELNKEFSALLHAENYDVIEVLDGEPVTCLLQEERVDLVVVGASLPDMTGFSLCRRIREQFSVADLPVLIIDEGTDRQMKLEAFRSGANDSLSLAEDDEEFLLRVRALLRTRKLTQEKEEVQYLLEQNVKERGVALEIANMNLLTVNEEILQMERARNEMLSAISHELGTPITLINSYIQAVKNNLIEENNPRYLDMIQQKLLLLERLTEDLSDLSKYRSGRMSLRAEALDPVGWLEELMVGLESDVTQSGRQFRFLGIFGRQPDCRLIADPSRLEQVFTNIVWNAVKFTEAGTGCITITAEIHEGGGQDAVLPHADADSELIIRIEDNGAGIDPAALPHIFDRFYKSPKTAKTKGSGLGLSIAKEIVLRHEGEIWAESEAGEGSCFYVALPLRR